jgi:hypothetical protein
MSGTDCWQCLQDLVGNSTFNGSMAGVRNLGARCGYRYETYQFYSGEPRLRIGSLSSQISPTVSPSAPPPPSLLPPPPATPGKDAPAVLWIAHIENTRWKFSHEKKERECPRLARVK